MSSGETKTGAEISGDMILKWKHVWSQVAAGLRSPFRSTCQMCRESAENGLKISVCVDFGFYLRRLHIPRCVLFRIALQQAEDGFLLNDSHILIDRDTKFIPFRDCLKAHTEIEPVLLPPRSPNCNAHVERFMLSLKTECVDRMILFGEASRQKALREFESHYHEERNHQGLDNLLIDLGDDVGHNTGTIECRERLGGLLRYYHRRAA